MSGAHRRDDLPEHLYGLYSYGSYGVRLDGVLAGLTEMTAQPRGDGIAMARPKKSRQDQILERARVVTFEELFGPSKLPRVEDSPASEHRPWVPFFRNCAPWDNKPRCPQCDTAAVAPTASVMSDCPATDLYCEACGHELESPRPSIIAWAWFAFGAAWGRDTDPSIDFVDHDFTPKDLGDGDDNNRDGDDQG